MDHATESTPGPASSTAYDIVQYPSLVRPQTHPARMAAIARLHGIDAAAPGRCCLLEIGCGDGDNLFPLALAYRDSRFVGIDLSAAAIERGEQLRSRLGLTNLSLVQADLCDWDPGSMHFDYVVAHGVYSWVPEPVRNALLALCRDRLTPQGIAYISYNALPGCNLRRMLWEMLRFHLRDITAPEERVAQALAFSQFLEADVLGNSPYAQVVRNETHDLVHKTDPALLFHDDLAELNLPLYIVDFVARARSYELEFLAEADYFEMSEAIAPPQVADQLRDLAGQDILLKEQYLDFLKGRRFRQTLLCRNSAPLRREVNESVIVSLDVTGQFSWQPEAVDLAPGVAMQFRGNSGAAFSSNHPAVKAALVRIGETFPAPQSVPDVVAAAIEHTATDAAAIDEGRAAVLQALLLGFQINLVTLLCDAPRFATQPGQRPRISALVRAQLEAGADLVTSLRPSVIRLENPLTRELLHLLDGSHDRRELLDALARRMANNPAHAQPGEPTQPAAWWREHLEPQIEPGLEQAAKLALLE